MPLALPVLDWTPIAQEALAEPMEAYAVNDSETASNPETTCTSPPPTPRRWSGDWMLERDRFRKYLSPNVRITASPAAG